MQGHVTPNYLTATPEEVIRASILWHPSLLAERLRDQAANSQRFAHETSDAVASKAALRDAAGCRAAASMVETEDVKAILWDLYTMIPTLCHACKLQCVPQFAKEIAGRWAQPSGEHPLGQRIAAGR